MVQFYSSHFQTDKNDNWWSKWRQKILRVSWLAKKSIDVTSITNYHSYQFLTEMIKNGAVPNFNCSNSTVIKDQK